MSDRCGAASICGRVRKPHTLVGGLVGTTTMPSSGDSLFNGGQTTFAFNLIALLRAQRAFGLTLIKGRIDRPYPRLATVSESAVIVGAGLPGLIAAAWVAGARAATTEGLCLI